MIGKNAKPAEDFQSIFNKSTMVIIENQRLNQAINSILQIIEEKNGDNEKLLATDNIADKLLVLQKLQCHY